MSEILIKMITLEESVHQNSVLKEGESNIELSKKKNLNVISVTSAATQTMH